MLECDVANTSSISILLYIGLIILSVSSVLNALVREFNSAICGLMTYTMGEADMLFEVPDVLTLVVSISYLITK